MRPATKPPVPAAARAPTRGLSRAPPTTTQAPPKLDHIPRAWVTEAMAATGVKEQDPPFPGSHLYTPGDGKPHPAILLLHGSEGGDAGFNDLAAVYLARAGFTVLSFDYAGKSKGIPHQLANVKLDRTLAAARWLKANANVAGKKLGLYGWSRGAEQALILASLQKDTKLLSAVAAHAPHATVVGSCVLGKSEPVYDAHGREQPGWLLHGKPKAPGPIEVEKFKGPIYLSHGTADETWDVDNTKRLEARLKKAGKHPEVHTYPGEGHVLQKSGDENEARVIAFFRRTLGT